jgi:hypothetical protein
MRIYSIIFCLVLFLAGAAAPAFAVNGVMQEMNGQRIVHVWGTNYEMGYAHGYLLNDEILEIMDLYSFPQSESEIAEYDWKLQFVADTFEFKQELLDEEQGIYDGMIDAGVSPFVEILGRDFTIEDLKLLTATRDLAGLLCTTLIAWADSTQTDPDVAGQLIAGHNTDFRYYTKDPYRAGEHSFLMAFEPSDPNHQRFVSITFPGFLGIVTGMNETGLSLATNRGAVYIETADMDLDPRVDVGIWATREALSLRDFDNDGVNSVFDMMAYYENIRHFGSLLVQFFGPEDRGDPPSVILEINNLTRAFRFPEDDPNLAPSIMLALNWEDKLMPTRQALHQMRYDMSIDKIVNGYNKDITRQKIWDYLYFNRGQAPISVTFVSSMLWPAQRRIAFAPRTEETTDPALTHQWYDFDDLFIGGPDDDAADDTQSDDTQPDDTSADDTGDVADDTTVADSGDDDDDSSGCGC